MYFDICLGDYFLEFHDLIRQEFEQNNLISYWHISEEEKSQLISNTIKLIKQQLPVDINKVKKEIEENKMRDRSFCEMLKRFRYGYIPLEKLLSMCSNISVFSAYIENGLLWLSSDVYKVIKTLPTSERSNIKQYMKDFWNSVKQKSFESILLNQVKHELSKALLKSIFQQEIANDFYSKWLSGRNNYKFFTKAVNGYSYAILSAYKQKTKIDENFQGDIMHLVQLYKADIIVSNEGSGNGNHFLKNCINDLYANKVIYTLDEFIQYINAFK